MKVLSISTDRKILEERSSVLGAGKGTSVLDRQIEYAARMEELHVIVFSLKKLGLRPRTSGNLSIYPTNSRFRIFYFWDAYMLGRKILRDKNFVRGATVITAQDPFETGLAGFLLSLAFSLPLQIQIHTDFINPHFQGSFLNWVRSVIAYFVIPRARGIRVVSDAVKNTITKSFSSIAAVISVLPVYVDIERITNTEPDIDLKKEYPQFKFILFMASRLTPEKRIDTALYALQHIVAEYPYVGLVIAGEGAEKKKLQKLATTLGISDHIVYVGWKDDLASYYKTCNIFLLTSAYEGYGMTLIEAAAARTCIITTPVGIARQYFKNDENCFVCPVGDSQCIYANVKDLLSNNAKRELFKQKIQDTIKGMALPKEQYADMYVKILEGLL